MARKATTLRLNSSKTEIKEGLESVAKAIKSQSVFKKDTIESENKRALATSLMNWANLVFAGLVVGQGLTEKIDFGAMIIGALGCVLMYIFAVRIMK